MSQLKKKERERERGRDREREGERRDCFEKFPHCHILLRFQDCTTQPGL